MATSSCGGDSGTNPKATIEALPVTAATVQAAVELMTTGPALALVPVSCGTSPAINCPSGTPGGAVSLAITRTALSVAPVSAGVYSIETDLTVTSLQDVPVYTFVAHASRSCATSFAQRELAARMDRLVRLNVGASA